MAVLLRLAELLFLWLSAKEFIRDKFCGGVVDNCCVGEGGCVGVFTGGFGMVRKLLTAASMPITTPPSDDIVSLKPI